MAETTINAVTSLAPPTICWVLTARPSNYWITVQKRSVFGAWKMRDAFKWKGRVKPFFYRVNHEVREELLLTWNYELRLRISTLYYNLTHNLCQQKFFSCLYFFLQLAAISPALAPHTSVWLALKTSWDDDGSKVWCMSNRVCERGKYARRKWQHLTSEEAPFMAKFISKKV